jgi:hypothetical protein
VPGRWGTVFEDRYVRPDLSAKDVDRDLPSLFGRFQGAAAAAFIEPEDLLDAMKLPQSNLAKDLLVALGNPASISPVIRTMRFPKAYRDAQRKALADDVINRRNYKPTPLEIELGLDKNQAPALDAYDKLEGQLNQWISLSYLTDAEATRALEQLKGTPYVASVARSTKLEFSAPPTDSFYSAFTWIAGSPPSVQPARAGQWGPKSMNMQSLWDLSTGHAYIGLLDSGTKSGQLDINGNPTAVHPDLARSFRQHHSFNFWAASVPGYAPYIKDVDEYLGYPVGSLPGALDSGRGHGTHVHGIIAAQHSSASGPVNQGVAGQCPGCSVRLGKVSGGSGVLTAPIIDAIYQFARSGVQVINMSLGGEPTINCGEPLLPAATSSGWVYNGGIHDNDGSHPWCQAIQFAIKRDVTIVAAAGNSKFGWNGDTTVLPFPARDKRVMAVGGVELYGDAGAQYTKLWNQQLSLLDSPARPVGSTGELGTNIGFNVALVAPARDIVSTFYPTADWSPEIRCGSRGTFTLSYSNTPALGLNAPSNPGQQWGLCTGTSMAAPFVTGITGIIRSLKPTLLSKDYQSSSAPSVRVMLAATSRIQSGSVENGQWDYNTSWGYGLPRGNYIAAQFTPTAKANEARMTPMFVLEHLNSLDNFYTTVPNMGSAAINAELTWPRTTTAGYCSPPTLPKSPYLAYRNPEGSIAYPGTQATICAPQLPPQPPPGVPPPPPPAPTPPAVCGCSYFRYTPVAAFYVITAPKDEAGNELFALHRYSRVAPDSTARHIYIARPQSVDPVNLLIANGWKYDGQEGHVHRPDGAQPVASTGKTISPLLLMVKSGTETYALATNATLTHWTGKGYSLEINLAPPGEQTGQLGWVYE